MLVRIITSEKAMNHLIDDNSVLSPYIYITSRLTLLWRTSFSINIIRCSVFANLLIGLLNRPEMQGKLLFRRFSRDFLDSFGLAKYMIKSEL